MRAYYVVDSDGLKNSETIHIPDGLTKEEAVVFVYGRMFQDYWTFDTPHAIYITDGSGYQFTEGHQEVY